MSSTTTKRIPELQHNAVMSLGFHSIEFPGEWACPKEQSKDALKPFNGLVRRGFAVRAEFNDRRFGYRIMNSGLDYLLETEPEEFYLEEAHEQMETD